MKKRKTLIIGVVSAFLALGLIGCGTSTESTSSQKIAASQNTEQSTVQTESEVATSAPETQTETEVSSKPDYPDSIDGIDISFSQTVNDDVTGNWRLAKVTTETPVSDYALDYYKHFFASDDEVHIIVNFSLNTTTSINCMAGQLFVTTYEYVKNEEASAKTLCSGSLIEDYTIDLKTGKIDK